MPLLSDAVQSKVISRNIIGAARMVRGNQPKIFTRESPRALSRGLRIPNNRFDSEERHGAP